MKKRLFRFHRRTLEESLPTCIEVAGIKDIAEKFRSEYSFMPEAFYNFRIEKIYFDESERINGDWSECHYVVADMDCPNVCYKGQCIGMCNFYEEGIINF